MKGIKKKKKTVHLLQRGTDSNFFIHIILINFAIEIFTFMCFFFTMQIRMFLLPRKVQRNIWIPYIWRRYYCHDKNNMSKIRNIGILAHIDAGKYSIIFFFSTYLSFYIIKC